MHETPPFFAQHGEDAWLWRHYRELLVTPGVYVDVGAEQESVGSNTRVLDHLGWRGLLIDADARALPALHTRRQMVAQAVISSRPEVSFEITSCLGLSRISAAAAELPTCQARRLDDLLREHRYARVDLLSVDVEGHEIEVLESCDLLRLHPRIIIVEYRTIVPDSLTSTKRYIDRAPELIEFFRPTPYRCVHMSKANLVWLAQ
jgi:FkbM family methyltransferase